MKKRIYLLLLSIVVIFFSCRDDSGKFEEQLFTNEQITFALKECVRITSDSTLYVLCVVDSPMGYYYFDSKAYRIELQAATKQVVDTLRAHDFGDVIDSLIFNLNKAAELCGNKMKSLFWTPLIKEITFPEPYKILHGGNNAITNYVKSTKQSELLLLLKTNILLEQFNALKLFSTWNMLQEEYYTITGNYISIDILDPAAQQMMDGFFKMMAILEEAVRKNPELGGDKKGWLYRVFATM